MGDVVVGISAVPADRTALHYTGGEPHAPTADFGVTHGIVHAAKGMDIRPHVGPIVSSDTFYDPDPERHRRWAARGVLAVEMEAAVLFTIAALRGVEAACVLVVSDLVGGEEFVRITDEELAAAVERMTRLALRGRGGRPLATTATGVMVVNPASDNGRTARRWPEIARAAAARGPRPRRARHRGGRARVRAHARRPARGRRADRGGRRRRHGLGGRKRVLRRRRRRSTRRRSWP